MFEMFPKLFGRDEKLGAISPEQLKEVLQSIETKYTALQEENHDLYAKLQEAGERIEGFEATKPPTTAKPKLIGDRRLLDTLKAQKNKTARSEALEKEKNDLEQKKLLLENEKLDLEEKNNLLEGRISDLEQKSIPLQNEKLDLEEKNNLLEGRISDLEQKNIPLENEKLDLEEKNNLLEGRISDLEQKNILLQNEKLDLEEKNNLLEGRISDLEQKNNLLENEKLVFELKLEENAVRIAELSKKPKAKTGRLQSLEDEKKSLEVQVEESAARIAELEERNLQNLQDFESAAPWKERESLRNQLEEMSEKYEQIGREHDKSLVEHQRLQELCEGLENEVERLISRPLQQEAKETKEVKVAAPPDLSQRRELLSKMIRASHA